MKKQRGFIMYLGIAAVVAIAGLSILLKIQSSRLASSKAETVAVQGKFDAFVSATKALGEQAIAKAKAQELADKANKEKVDADHKKTVAALAAESARLRNARSSERFLPTTGTATPSPTVTADRAKLEAALRDFDSAVTTLVDRGDQAIADLNAVKAWAAK